MDRGLAPTAAAFEFPGTPRYSVLSRLGSGGNGAVFKVKDRDTGALLALKALHARRADELLRFKNEFRALRDIQHPNLIGFRELGEAGGVWFFTMELAEGEDFLSFVRGGQPGGAGARFDEQRLRDLLRQLARGLDALHQRGKIHRDIKPSNIVVTAEGRLVLLDFGLVLDTETNERLSEEWVIGTAAYIAPEQARTHGVCPASDLYAMGCLTYQALTGQVPFVGPDVQVLLRKQQEDPLPPRALAPGVPADLDELCMALLVRDPDKRPAASDVLARLGDVAPPRRRRPSTGPRRTLDFVGRETELARLLRELDGGGEARGVVVRAPSGTGKSELLAELARRVARERPDAVALAGRCYENESVPFKAVDGVVDALARRLRSWPRDRAASMLPRNAGVLVQVFPVLSRVEVFAEAPRARAQLSPLELRRRAFAALRELLVRLARLGPVLITIDDLQWADDDSALLLAELLQPPEAPPIVLVMATRPVAEGETAVEELLPGPTAVLELGPLAPADAVELARRSLRAQGADPALASELAREAGGHPLFLQELVQHVATAGAHATRAARLDDALRSRVAQLGDDARRVLGLVCVAGVPLPQAGVAPAADLELEDFGRAVAELRAARLVWVGGGRRTDRIEPYHDRIRESVAAGLSADERETAHRRLADAFDATGIAERQPELAMRHLADGGQPARAALYAEVAATRAANGLAFERAAALYLQALRLGESAGAERARLLAARAEALVSAGRGAAGAELFLELAETTLGFERLEYQRRAAEQLLLSGHVDRGMQVIAQVLDALGESLPSTPSRALWSLAWGRIRVRLRGLRWREREESELAPRDLAKLEVYGALAAGLSLVNNIRGADLQARYVLRALELGERSRVARALGLEGLFAAGLGADRRARAVVAMASEVAEEAGSASALAFSGFCRAAVSYFLDNDWLAARDRLVEVERLLRDQIQAGGWETDSVQMYRCFCELYLGELRQLETLVSAYIRDADRRGDLYAATNLRTRLALPRLLDAEARRLDGEIEEALALWTGERDAFQVPHFFALHSRCEIALYQGEPRRAANLMARNLVAFKRSMMLRAPIVATEVTILRGRIALAIAFETRDPSERGALLAEVKGFAKRLERSALPLARNYACALRAGLAIGRGDDDSAVAELRALLERSEACHTEIYAVAGRRELGRLLGGDEGATLLADAEAWMERQNAAEPHAMWRTILPWPTPGWRP